MSHTPGLVEQLQAEAINSQVPISDLLRKAKVVAIKLKQDDFTKWLDHEVSGYPPDTQVPPYRAISTSIKFHNPYYGWRPVIGTDQRILMRTSMAEIASLLAAEGSYFTAPAPKEIADHVIKDLGFGVEVSYHIARTSLATIVEAVRDAINDWALKLESAGVLGAGMTFSQSEKQKAQSVVINIGSIGNASGIGVLGEHASIIATQVINLRDWANKSGKLALELEEILVMSRLPVEIQSRAADQVAELKAASAATNPDCGKIRKILESLQRTMEGAAGNLIASGVIATISSLLSSAPTN